MNGFPIEKRKKKRNRKGLASVNNSMSTYYSRHPACIFLSVGMEDSESGTSASKGWFELPEYLQCWDSYIASRSEVGNIKSSRLSPTGSCLPSEIGGLAKSASRFLNFFYEHTLSNLESRCTRS
jgi:hypothetical protein